MNIAKLDFIDSIFKYGINIKFDNKELYEYMKKGLNISTNLLNINKIENNDNSFYKCLSKYLYDKMDYHESLQKTIFNIWDENKDEIDKFKKNELIKNLPNDKYIDILLSSFLFCLNISIYKYSNDKLNLENLYSFIYEENIENSLNKPLMVLIYEGSEHFDLVSSKKLLDEHNNIIKNKDKEDKKVEIFNSNINKFDTKYENEIFNLRDRYLIENNRLYIGIYEHNNNLEKKLIYKKYMISYAKDLKGILNKCHDQNNHKGAEETIDEIKKNNYYWQSIYKDVNKYIKDFSFCNKE